MDGRSRAHGLHRWPKVVLATLVLVGVTFLAVRFVWLPWYRPGLHAGERLGIDVSHHQGTIDWERVADDGITFAYIKATEGGDFLDDRFLENWEGAGEAGIDRGAYHFYTLCTQGLVQAEQFLDVLPDAMELPPAVDLELEGNCANPPDPSVVVGELRDFVSQVEARTEATVVLYVSDDFEAQYRVARVLPRSLWTLSFVVRPNGDWLIWQVGGFAHIEGISGAVDLDVMRGSAVSVTREREAFPTPTV